MTRHWAGISRSHVSARGRSRAEKVGVCGCRALFTRQIYKLNITKQKENNNDNNKKILNFHFADENGFLGGAGEWWPLESRPPKLAVSGASCEPANVGSKNNIFHKSSLFISLF